MADEKKKDVSEQTQESNERQKPTLMYSLITLALIVILIAGGLVYFGAPIQTLFFLSWLIIIPACMKLGYPYKELEDVAFDFMRRAMQPIIIILAVGALVGTWIAAGTVPGLIYIGLGAISPAYFLLTTLILCSLTSLATGTSWGTMGTAGLAMMGVGAGLGVPVGMTAGAVISGAYFGDKMSPLSDSTNLAAAVSEGELITHVKHMFYTVGPAYVISAILFTVVGLRFAGEALDVAEIELTMTTLADNYTINIITFIPAIVLIALLAMQKPPVTSILVGAVVGGIVAVMLQGYALSEVLGIFYSGHTADTGVEAVDSLLTRGGVVGMWGTVGIMLFAFGLAGMMHHAGMMAALLDPLVKKVRTVGQLTLATMAVSYVSNGIGASMSFASVMTGTLMTPLYKEWNLAPANLSRIIEACGTLGAPLIPWNSNAIFAMSMLGATPFQYIPWAFLNYITPIVALIYGFTGFTVYPTDKSIPIGPPASISEGVGEGSGEKPAT